MPLSVENITADPYEEALQQLLSELIEIRGEIEKYGNERLKKYQKYYRDGAYTNSAFNLAFYLAMRQFDLRHLQDRLAHVGLSSLGRTEASVVPTFDAMIDLLKRATDKHYRTDPKHPAEHGFNRGLQLLEQHSVELFGPFHQNSKTHVMVTFSPQTAWDYGLVHWLMRKGMTCARINCAHDDATVWQKMIANIRRAETETGRSCRLLMDLAGHKIRTGPLALEAAIHHIKVKKDRAGNVVANGYLVLTAETGQSATNGNFFKVPIGLDLHKKLAPGMMLEFHDNQDKQRFLKIEKALSSFEWLVSCEKDAYLVSGCPVKLHKPDQNTHNKRLETFALGQFAGEPVKIRVEKGEALFLSDEKIPGKPAQYSSSGVLVHPAHIGCTLASALTQLETGQPVWLDDGKIGAVVEQVSDQGALLRITVAKPGGVSIKSDRGINFPETDLKLPPLSEKDLADLDFVCAHADMIGFSFVETLADMDLLMAELAKRKASEIPIIAKIETNKAVKNLPDIVLGSIGRHKLGIMIARGDLAVELGSARLAEIQEEMLWLCEAAHVPVIWATQVLESIAKKGTRSRPEFTDAAMAVRAECVMLNKGPFILDAIEALVNVMVRMQEHQRKKFSRLRALHW
jgi:pyruvate kinase